MHKGAYGRLFRLRTRSTETMPVTSMEDDEAILRPEAGKPDDADQDGAEDGIDGLDDDGEEPVADDDGDTRAAADDDGEELDAGYERDPTTGRFALSPKAKSDMWKLREGRRKAKEDADRERARADVAERRLAELERTASKEETDRLDAEVVSLKARKKAALESTDLEAYDEASEALLEARLRRERIGTQRPERGDGAPAPRAPAGNGMAPFARAWVEANADWFDPGGKSYDAARRDRALQENARLSKRYDVNDPRLYDELNRAVKGDASGDDDPRRAQHNGPSPPTRPGVGTQRRGRRLSSQDIASMRNYGLDPNDASARREWLKNQAV